MLNIKEIFKNQDKFIENLKSRNIEIASFKDFFTLIATRSKKMQLLQTKQAYINKISKAIGLLKNQKQPIDEKMINDLKEVKFFILKIQKEVNNINIQIKERLNYIPNLVNFNLTPIGKNENDNIIANEYNHIGKGLIKDNIIPHYEIGKKLNILDFKRGVKLSGSRFWIFKNEGALLVRALENFMLHYHIKNGYSELKTPVLVKEEIMYGTGQLPKFKKDLFKIEDKNLYLIPTNEVTITNFYNNEIIDLEKPQKFVGSSLCFRSEAGSGGKDLKGLIRAHQFIKVELVKFVKKEHLLKEYQKTIEDAKAILKLLKLPFQEVKLCSGDLGFSAEATSDLEVWIPSENKYREVSSISSFNNFQGRRANIRYYDENKKTSYAYTINGSGLSIDRVVASILENYQNNDGTIEIPKVLIKYMYDIEKIIFKEEK